MWPRSAAPSGGIAFALMFATTCFAVDYCYDQHYCSPHSWGDAYPSCHPIVGAHHSPINLHYGSMARNGSLRGVRLEGFDLVHPGLWRLKNNGHSVVLDLGGGMAVMDGGLPGTYRTLQLHFHWGSPSSNGSEHTVDSRRYPMEMHIVSMKTIHHNLTSALHDPSGLAVLGVFIDVTELDNDNFTAISSLIPSIAYKGRSVAVKPFPLLNLLPAQNLSQFYRYHGSLTTPPCSQAVVWTVYEVPIYVSQGQVDAFTSGLYQSEEGGNGTLLQRNFRHVHETFSREVLASRDAVLLPASGAASAACPAPGLALFALLLLAARPP